MAQAAFVPASPRLSHFPIGAPREKELPDGAA